MEIVRQQRTPSFETEKREGPLLSIKWLRVAMIEESKKWPLHLEGKDKLNTDYVSIYRFDFEAIYQASDMEAVKGIKELYMRHARVCA